MIIRTTITITPITVLLVLQAKYSTSFAPKYITSTALYLGTNCVQKRKFLKRTVSLSFIMKMSTNTNNYNNHQQSNYSNNSFLKLDSPSADRNKEPIWNIITNYVLPHILLLPNSSSNENKNELHDKHPNATTIMNVLEIASGSGIHTYYFTKQLHKLLLLQYDNKNSDTSSSITSIPTVHWYPTDMDVHHRQSITAYIQDDIELIQSSWIKVQIPPSSVTLNQNGIIELEQVDMKRNQPQYNEILHTLIANQQFHFIFNINMIHISSWDTTIGLMKVVGSALQFKSDTISNKMEKNKHIDSSISSSSGIFLLYGPFKVNGTYCESNRMFDLSLRQRNEEWGIRDIEAVIELANNNGLQLFMEPIEMPANNLCILFHRKVD